MPHRRAARSIALMAALLCALSGVVSAQAVRVKDVIAVDDASWSGNPSQFVTVAGTTYFVQNTPREGVEMWRTNGTTAGTRLVKDIWPGSGFSTPRTRLVQWKAPLLGRGPGSRCELWASDGSGAGTVPLKNICAAVQDRITVVNGAALFAACDAWNGCELWKTDGTADGTVLVKDIQPGSSSSQPVFLRTVNGTLFFSADDGTNGSELWKSDGTTVGTVLVANINPATGAARFRTG